MGRRNLSDTWKEHGSSHSCRGPSPDCYDRADTRVNEFVAIATGLINFTIKTFPYYLEVSHNNEFHAHTWALCDLHVSSSLRCSAVVIAIVLTLFGLFRAVRFFLQGAPLGRVPPSLQYP